MDHLKQIEAFRQRGDARQPVGRGAGRAVTPAVIGRRLDALEARLGVKLLLRTTRKLSLTFEGQAFLEDCQRILNDLANAEAAVSLGGIQASGHLRVSAPAGFGRRHVAPQVAAFMQANPEVSVRLDLTDRLVDLLNEGVDCAVRIGEMADSSLAVSKLGEMRRLVVASPSYLARTGCRRPRRSARHNCLSLGQQRGWALRQTPAGEVTNHKVAAASSATMAPSCTNGRWPARAWRGARCGKWATICARGAGFRAGRLCRRRRWASTPFSRSAGICPCVSACSSTSQEDVSATRSTGSGERSRFASRQHAAHDDRAPR
jgi:DNA-binding transcriptional LysR family regulator